MTGSVKDESGVTIDPGYKVSSKEDVKKEVAYGPVVLATR